MTAHDPARRRGQPVVLLGILLSSWIAVRAAVWEPPFDLRELPQMPFAAMAVTAGTSTRPAAAVYSANALSVSRASLTQRGGALPMPLSENQFNRAVLRPPVHMLIAYRLPAPDRSGVITGVHLAPGISGSRSPFLLGRSAAQGTRWSADGWLLVRGGPGGRGLAGGGAGYGGSQAGAVLRYRLAPGSGHRPAAYLRIDGALAGRDPEREVAGGLALRPFAGLPVAVLVEGRLVHAGTSTRFRPAAAVVTELPPLRLPLGAEGEFYGQAGYVGGAGATPFFDAQASIERPVGATGQGLQVRLGGGAWAGGQRGAARLDLGPRASVRFAAGKLGGRLSLDWRVRVAGNAAPGSGPALTLSAGF